MSNIPGKKENKPTHKTALLNPEQDLSQDPFFVKKVEASKKIVEKYGLPELAKAIKK